VYRDILVHIKAHETWSPHIDAAIALAKRSNAWLSGLLTLRDVALAKQLAPTAVDNPMIGEIQAEADARTAALKAKFESALAAAGIKGGFDSAEGRANEILTLAGRFHDLLVIEQTDPARDEANWESAEEAAVLSGRPTLIIPRTGDFTMPFKRVLVAWNGSREATRALHAALPMIEAADSAVLVQGHGRDGWPSVTRAPQMDIEGYLRRHAKSVERAGPAMTDADAPAGILAAAAANRCDLIVMGAYGRAGLARLIFGGATVRVFHDTITPILAAH
jgi:nucleotide-binding universal stress UspA family protein